MREDFAITKNVQRFIQGVEVVNTPIKGRIGNGLFFGPPGTGKTDVGQWYSAEKGVPYIRARKVSSQRSLLAIIVNELGLSPAFRSDDLFQQIVEELIGRPTPIIIDEVDYLLKNNMVEILRDINDMTNTPIIMMGMEHVDKKLRLCRHLYDRFTAIIRFELFDKKEIANLAEQACAVQLSDCGVEFIEKKGQGKLRLTMTWFTRAEQLGKRNGLDQITAAHLQAYEDGKK